MEQLPPKFVLKQVTDKEIAIHPEKVAHGMRAQGWEFSLSTRPAFKGGLVAWPYWLEHAEARPATILTPTSKSGCWLTFELPRRKSTFLVKNSISHSALPLQCVVQATLIPYLSWVHPLPGFCAGRWAFCVFFD